MWLNTVDSLLYNKVIKQILDECVKALGKYKRGMYS